METPLVSILLASYNAETFIVDTIKSVIDNAYQNWELIISDDKSSDRTIELVTEISSNDSRIKIFSHMQNIGDYPNRNRAASYANGKYIKYLDHDDLIYKYSLCYMVEAMESNKEAALGLGFSLVDDILPYPIVNLPNQTFREEYIGKGFLGYGPSASIIKKSAFEAIGGFLENSFVGDQDLWMRIALQYPVIKLQPALVWYRVHPLQESRREKKDIFNMNIRHNIRVDYLNKAKMFFSENEYRYANDKLNQNFARLILREIIIKRNFLSGLKLYKKSPLSFFDLLKGFTGYKK
jgi:glycosyltransferase involved in cell wall biosynthesis